MRRARRSCGTVAATWLRESCAARVPGATFYFLFIARCTSGSLLRIVHLAGPAAPSGAGPASRHPPPAAARLGARPSRSPVGREPARRRAARGRAPAAEGSGLRARPGPARWQASTARPTTTRRRPSVRREIRNRFTRRKRKSASARPVDTGARREPANVPRPLRQGSRSARERAATRVGRWAIPEPPNCSRRSAKIQKVWLSCVAR